MYSLTICFGAATPWMLLFKTEESAKKLFNAYVDHSTSDTSDSTCLIGTDDFGQAIAVSIHDVTGMLLEDMDASQLGQVERGLHQARTQAKANDRGMTDPVIRASAMAQQRGPAVMSPVPGSRFS